MKRTVSIVIPTYNAGSLLGDVIEAILGQTVKPREVLIIDSSSTDGTPALIERYPVTLHSIKKAEFGHGRTRNYGARLATSDYVVFLTQDAVPRNKEWLGKLIKHLDTPTVVAAFSKQIARDDAVPMERFFYQTMYPAQSYEIKQKDVGNRPLLFSNASSAINRAFLLQHPFAENILMSEDLEWAVRLLADGQTIRYEAASQVTHSHDTTFSKLFKRYFDFGVSHHEIRATQRYTLPLLSGLWLFFKETNYLLRTKNGKWLPRAIAYNAAKFSGLVLGRMHTHIPRKIKRRLTSSYQSYWV